MRRAPKLPALFKTPTRRPQPVTGRRARRFLKLRSDSKFASFTAAQKEKLFQWLTSGRSYDEVIPLVKKHFGLRTSNGALSGYYARVVSPRLLAHSPGMIALSNDCLVSIVVEIKPGCQVVLRIVKGPKGKIS